MEQSEKTLRYPSKKLIKKSKNGQSWYQLHKEDELLLAGFYMKNALSSQSAVKSYMKISEIYLLMDENEEILLNGSFPKDLTQKSTHMLGKMNRPMRKSEMVYVEDLLKHLDRKETLDDFNFSYNID